MSDTVNRRSTLILLAGAVGLAALPAQAALDDAKARALIDRVVADINRIINSGRSESAMYGEFEKLFRRYADVPIISRSTLGPEARRATPAQLNAFADAFAGFLSRKYGKRFREFIGGQIEVQSSKKVKEYYEVTSVTRLAGQAPFQVVFRVSDRSGRDLFFDIVIEGISLLKTERTEVLAMLDRRRGDIDALIRDLRTAG
jgi:phospholipid transport system substrate-binding protein